MSWEDNIYRVTFNRNGRMYYKLMVRCELSDYILSTINVDGEAWEYNYAEKKECLYIRPLLLDNMEKLSRTITGRAYQYLAEREPKRWKKKKLKKYIKKLA